MALAVPDEILATVRTVLTWDLTSPDLPAASITLSMLDQLTSHGRTAATTLSTLYLPLPPDSEAGHTARASLGEASRRLCLPPPVGTPQATAHRAQSIARLLVALLNAAERSQRNRHISPAHTREFPPRKARPMKTSHAVLALTAVATAGLVQRERHHKQQKEATLAKMQERWLTLLITHPDLAVDWKPADMPVEEYVKLLNANQQLCSLTLRYRLGLITKERLRFYATYLMKNENVRQYWEAFGTLREEEALGDNRATDFNEAMGDAYDALIGRPEQAAGI